MSREIEKSVKAELNKHINSKLFRKFLEKEAARIPDTISQVKTHPRSSLRKSPDRIIREDSEISEEKRNKSASRVLSKAMSQKE